MKYHEISSWEKDMLQPNIQKPFHSQVDQYPSQSGIWHAITAINSGSNPDFCSSCKGAASTVSMTLCVSKNRMKRHTKRSWYTKGNTRIKKSQLHLLHLQHCFSYHHVQHHSCSKAQKAFEWNRSYQRGFRFLYIYVWYACKYIYIYARGGRFTEGSLSRILWMFKNCYFVVVKREFLKKSFST